MSTEVKHSILLTSGVYDDLLLDSHSRADASHRRGNGRHGFNHVLLARPSTEALEAPSVHGWDSASTFFSNQHKRSKCSFISRKPSQAGRRCRQQTDEICILTVWIDYSCSGDLGREALLLSQAAGAPWLPSNRFLPAIKVLSLIGN